MDKLAIEVYLLKTKVFIAMETQDGQRVTMTNVERQISSSFGYRLSKFMTMMQTFLGK
jgi:S-adenosylmethionine synthetase